MIKLKINNRAVEVPEGSTVMQAAGKLGIAIPTFCFDDFEKTFGKHCSECDEQGICRMCSCEIKGREKLLIACSTAAKDGMEVWTESPKVKKERIDLLHSLIAVHPMDCQNCRQLGECRLQKYCEMYGVSEPQEQADFLHREKDLSSRFFAVEPDKCIRCGKCVKVCRDLVGIQALIVTRRENRDYVVPRGGSAMNETACVSCGNCVSVCSVGALMPKSLYHFRQWEAKKVRTTCAYCGVGCQIEFSVKDGKIVDSRPAYGPSNNGLLCVKGKFAFDFINHRDRLKYPMIRKNGKLVRSSWEEALDLAASKIREVKETCGPDAIAGFSSARTVNEDNYLFQKFIRAAVGTNNVDHCARLCHSSTVAGLATTLGSGAMTNTIAEVKDADVIFITGSNTTETHPVMGMYVRQAKKMGKKLIVADPVRIPLAEIADIYLQINPGSSVALSNGMLHVIFAEGLEDLEYIEQHTEGIEALRECVRKYTPEKTAEICGVDKELIIKAARMYAGTHKSYIAYAMGITQHVNGTDNVSSLSNLALVTGNIGKVSSGVNPLRGQNNVQGACDMGALPTDYPAYQKVFLPEVQEKFEKAWGVKLSSQKGYTVTETIPAILEDKVKFLYIMGENPMVSDPDTAHVQRALEKAFVVVQDIFPNETTEYADIVFPSAAFAEKDGTFTNTERRVQRVRRVVPAKGECREDWWTLMQLMNRIGYPCHYDSVKEIFDEMRTVTPSYEGITYKKIEEAGVQWPCPSEDHPGTPVLHVNGPGRKGGGLLKAIDWVPSPDTLDPEYPMTLTSCRILYHYHTRTMTDKVPAIHFTAPRNWIEIDMDDAAELNIRDGEWVKVSSRRGAIFAEARIADTLQPGVAWMPFHYAGGANMLSDSEHLDPVCKIPGFKQIGIKIEKVSEQKSRELTKEAEKAEIDYYENEDPAIIRYEERTVEEIISAEENRSEN